MKSVRRWLAFHFRPRCTRTDGCKAHPDMLGAHMGATYDSWRDYPLRHRAAAAVSTWIGWRGELWWRAEKMSGRLWHLAARGRADCWLNWLPAFTYSRRKQAERRHFARREGRRS